MGVHDGPVPASHRPTQPDLTSGRDRRLLNPENFGAAGQHASIDHVGVVRPGDRLAEPGRVPVGYETNPTPRLGDRMQ